MATTSEEIRLIIRSEMKGAIADFNKLNRNINKTDQSFMKKAVSLGVVSLAMKKLIGAASDLAEETTKFNKVFAQGEGVIDKANKSVETLTTTYAMSTREARKNMAAMQDLLKPLGIAPDKAWELSDAVVRLSADMGSFNNLPTAQVMGDIQSALVGMNRPMMKYGAVLNANLVKQEAMAMGLFDGRGEISASARAQAAFNLILKAQGDAQGDMIRTGDSWANTQKKIFARLEDTAATIGNEMLPGMRALGQAFLTSASEGGILLESLKAIARGIGFVAKGLGNILLGMEAMSRSKGMEFAAKQQEKQMNLFKQQKAAVISYYGSWARFQKLVKAGNKQAILYQQGLHKILKDGQKMGDIAGDNANRLLTLSKAVHGDEIKNSQDALNKKLNNYKVVETKITDVVKKEKEKRKESTLDYVNSTIEGISMMHSAIGGIADQFFKNRTIELDNDYKKQKENIEKSTMDEEQKKIALEKLDKKFEKKRAKLARDQAKSQKAIAIIGATINTAQAVTKALAQGGFFAGPAFAAVVGALGAAQIALIASQPLPKAERGGVIKGSAAGTALIAGEAGKSEAIIPLEDPEAQRKLGGIGRGGVNISIQNFYATGDSEQMAVQFDRAMYKLYQDGDSQFAEALK